MIRNDESTAGSRQPRNESRSSSNSDYERSALVSAWSDEDNSENSNDSDDSENSDDSEESEVSDEVDSKESGRDESSSADEHCNGHIALISRKRYNQTSLQLPSQESIILLDHSESNKILDHSESNIILDHSESNIVLDHSESNIIIGHSENEPTPTSNISNFTLAFEKSILSSEINEINEINEIIEINVADNSFVPLTSPKHEIFPICDQPDTCSASDQPSLSVASDQPCNILVFDQSVSIVASDKPCIGLASEQPDSTLASDQPVHSLASDQPCISLTSDQPSIGLALEQPINSLATEQPSNSLASEQHCMSLTSDQLEQYNKSSGSSEPNINSDSYQPNINCLLDQSNTISDVGSDQANEEQSQNEQKQTPVFQKTITTEEILEEASEACNQGSDYKVAFDFYKPNLIYEETSSITDNENKPITYSETEAVSHDITENIYVSEVNSVNTIPRPGIDDESYLTSVSEEHKNPNDELNLNELNVENNVSKAENKTSLRNKEKHNDTNKDNELKENCSFTESMQNLNCQNQLLRNQEGNDPKEYNDCQFAIECSKQLNDDINQIRDTGEAADHDAQGKHENNELRVESDLTIHNFIDPIHYGTEPTDHENGQDVLKTNQLDSVINFSVAQGDQNTNQTEVSQEYQENELIKPLLDLSKADILLRKTGLEIADLSESDIIFDMDTVISRERKYDSNNDLHLHNVDDTIEIKDDAENQNKYSEYQSETFKNQSEIELNQSDPIDIIDKVLKTTDQISTNENKLQEINLENQAIVENKHDQEQKEHCQDHSELNQKISSVSRVNSAHDQNKNSLDLEDPVENQATSKNNCSAANSCNNQDEITYEKSKVDTNNPEIDDEPDIGSDDEGSEFSVSDLSWYKEYLGPVFRYNT